MSLPLQPTIPNLYTTLSLPSPPTGRITSTSEIKAAIRRALLLHHPDKAHVLLSSTSTSPDRRKAPPPHTDGLEYDTGRSQPAIDIDTILLARDILLNPISRREYDRHLSLSLSQKGDNSSVEVESQQKARARPHPTELDTVDLDDMTYHEATQSWTRPCRCGNTASYEVTEEDLESAVAVDGGNGRGEMEVLVGCEGCSLWIRVVFEAVEDEDGGEKEVCVNLNYQ